MKIISFAWTTPALLAGEKTVTRRDWKLEYARRFRADEECWAYNKSPRIGGKAVAVIRLTEAPRLEPLADMLDSDFEAEGFGWFEKRGRGLFSYSVQTASPDTAWAEFEAWRQSGRQMWVVRFKLLKVIQNGVKELDKAS